MDTNGYRGSVKKKARVFTNIPNSSPEVISIQVYVRVPIYISTRYVYLTGTTGESITRTIKIKAEKDKPLTIEPNLFDLKDKVTYKIEEVASGKEYRIHFTTMPGAPKKFNGSLKLKTNYPEKPEITIKVRGRISG